MMNNFSNLDDIFAPKGVLKEPEQAKVVMYSPSAKNTKNGKYTACVRFIPWHKDPNNSIVIKQQAYLKDPLTGKGRYIDSKRTVNEQCPIADTFWNLYNTKNAALMDFAKANISLNTTYTALVQIIQDEQHPELVGKILPWRFGKTIWEKLYQEQHPSMGIAYNPFDIINGRYFSIDITQKGGWNNYDNCRFFDYRGQNGETSGMLYKNAMGQFMITTAASDKQEVYNYLVNESPDFSIYAYREWTPEDNAYVTNVLATITNYANTGSYGQNVNMAVNNIPVTPQVVMPSIGTPVGTTTTAPMQPMSQPISQPVINTMPNINQINNATQISAQQIDIPAAPQIVGIDLPDIGMPGTTQMQTPATPVAVGMGLEEMYNSI